MRNSTCFQRKWSAESVSVIFDVCRWINLWAKLEEAEQGLLTSGARVNYQVANEVFGARGDGRHGLEDWKTRRIQMDDSLDVFGCLLCY